MIYHRILEIIAKSIKDNDKKTEILHIIKELLKKKCNSCEVFFDIFKHIGIDIKNLYSSVAPYLFIAFSDNKCCSLVWKVDKYIDIEGNPVIVPSRCAKNRIDKSSLYCRSHNNPKLNQYCNLCSKHMEECIYHQKNWEHFGNIFQFDLNPCFKGKNLDNCYNQNYLKSKEDLRCVSYAEFFIEQNKKKWMKYAKTISVNCLDNRANNVIIKYDTMHKQTSDVIISKKKTNNSSDLSNINYKIDIDNIESIDLDNEHLSFFWCLLLNHIFHNNPKIENSISTITIFDKEDISLYTNGKFIYNSNFKIDGILLNSDIVVFSDEIDKYVNSLDISKIDNKLIKVFIKEVLQ
jgi:hypothetical protein